LDPVAGRRHGDWYHTKAEGKTISRVYPGGCLNCQEYGGTGLGLAISYRYAHLMKGRISVESEPGRGSVFTVDIPSRVMTEAADAAQAEKFKDLPSAADQTKSNVDTILVIDDDSVVRDLMSRFLTKLGFRVVAAPVAKKAASCQTN